MGGHILFCRLGGGKGQQTYLSGAMSIIVTIELISQSANRHHLVLNHERHSPPAPKPTSSIMDVFYIHI